MTTGEVGASGLAFATLAKFLEGSRFTGLIKDLESALEGTDKAAAAVAGTDAGIDAQLLTAALTVRRDVGRLNDLIHAAAITLALRQILEPGETLTNRPSLAAGNDPSRPFDLETNLRVAEFKVAGWSPSGSDAMRKRGVFHDLVHLAAGPLDKCAELYVVGPRPLTFLRKSKTTARWALNRGSDSTRDMFVSTFGPLDMTVRDFTSGPGSRVRLIDLSAILPGLAGDLT